MARDRRPVVINLAIDGDDRADGRSAPVATPERAQRLARRHGAAVVRVHPGTYELRRTLRFTAADRGQVWTVQPGTRAVLSGGRRLAGWTVGRHRGQACWTLDLPEVRRGSWRFTQLWVDGQRRARPRLPRTGFHRFAGLDGQGDSGFAWHQGPDRAEYAPGDLARYRNLDDVTLVSYQLWFDTHLRIRRLDPRRRLVHFHARAIGSLRDETGAFARYVAVNVFEGLVEPGEWYLDRAAGRLHYLPLPGEDPATTVVVAPRLQEVVRFAGASGVRLERLGLHHSEWSRQRGNPGTVQAAYDVPGTVVFDRAEGCALFGCEIAHCAGYGVEMLGGCHRNAVAACTIRDLGGGGVKIGHEELAVHEAAVGKRLRRASRRPMAATVADCHIHDGGLVYPSAIGVWIGNSGFNRVQHNRIHHFAYTGISCGWIWGFAPSRTVDNRIDRNHIHHINHQRLLSDNGGIYTLGIQPGTTVVGNHLHDIACHGYGGWGLYPDEGSSGIRYRDNLVHDVQYCGFSAHYGRFLTVENNIFARMERAMLSPGRADLSCGHRFERNLVWFERGNLKPDADWDPALCATRRNLVWNAAGTGVRWQLGTLSAEQAAGRWLGSVEADPLFGDPRSGDFALRADSPALALGFRPFDWRRAGPRRMAGSATGWSGYRLPAAPPRPVAVARIAVREAGGGRLRARIAVVNPSLLPVRGTYRIVATGGPGVRIHPGTRFAIDLVPGSQVVHEIGLELPSGHRGWLQARGDERTCFSAAARIAAQTRVAMPRLADVRRLAADGLPIAIAHAGRRVLAARAAIIDGALAVDAEVEDPRVAPDPAHPWNGSAVELFVAPDPLPAGPSRPLQIFAIAPDAADHGVLRRADGGGVAGARYDARRTPAGWRFAARLPLAGLGLAASARRLRFDLIHSGTSPIAGQNLLRLAAWGTLGDHADSRLLAIVDVGATTCDQRPASSDQ